MAQRGVISVDCYKEMVKHQVIQLENCSLWETRLCEMRSFELPNVQFQNLIKSACR